MRLETLDWAALAAYLALVGLIGALASRGSGRSAEAFFLASRRTPVLAAALSVVATALSAATFLGAPEDAYLGDATYLTLSLGSALGAVLVACWFIPVFYRAKTATVYAAVELRIGGGAGKLCSGMFLLGRLLASGARLYIAAIPVAIVLLGGADPARTLAAILLVAMAAAAYTAAGGVRAVIWTDALQAVVLVCAAAAALWLLLGAGDAAGLFETLAKGATAQGTPKLRVIDTRMDLSAPYTLWSALLGFTLLNAAAYGADQDLTQRLLTCPSARKGAASLLAAAAIGAAVSGLFLLIGLLLWAREQTQGAATAAGDTRSIFLDFLLLEAPPGVRGLAVAGLVAAAMSSLDSALSSMASAVVCDFVEPWRRKRGQATSVAALARWTTLALAGLLALAAAGCLWWHSVSGQGLLRFALGVMVYAYAGLLGVFLTALFTRSGSTRSTLVALIAGPAVVAALQFGPGAVEQLGGAWPQRLRPSVGWRMAAGTLVAFLCCAAGRRSAAEKSA